jgi:hypothetical protein
MGLLEGSMQIRVTVVWRRQFIERNANMNTKNTGPRPESRLPVVQSVRFAFGTGAPDEIRLRRGKDGHCSASYYDLGSRERTRSRYNIRPFSPRPAYAIGSNALNLD